MQGRMQGRLGETGSVRGRSCMDQPALSATAQFPLPSTLTPVSLWLIQVGVRLFRIVHGFLQRTHQVLLDLAHDHLPCGFSSTFRGHVCRLPVPCPCKIAFRLLHRNCLSSACDGCVILFVLQRELPRTVIPAQVLVQENYARREPDAGSDSDYARPARAPVAPRLDFGVDLQDGTGPVLPELFPLLVRLDLEVRREHTEARDILRLLRRSPWLCQSDGRGPALLFRSVALRLACQWQHQREHERRGQGSLDVVGSGQIKLSSMD